MNTEITVLAGNGKSGRRVAAALRAAGHRVRVASRSSDVRFDWQDARTWPAVTDGVGALYLVAPDDPAPLRPFVDLVQEAGVKRLVLLSGRAAGAWQGRFGHAMAVAEDVVRASDLSWTVVGANNFMQNFTEDLWHAPLLAGRLALPTGGVPEPFVDLDDVAAVVARLLTAGGFPSRTLEVSGPTALTFGAAVAAIAAASGRRFGSRSSRPPPTRTSCARPASARSGSPSWAACSRCSGKATPPPRPPGSRRCWAARRARSPTGWRPPRPRGCGRADLCRWRSA